MNQEGMKPCSKCGVLTLLADLYNYGSKDTLWCQACVNNQYNAWKARNTLEEAVEITEKRCGVCKRVKPVKDFYKDRANKTGLRWCCKKCSDKQAKKWRRHNIKHIREYARIWQTNKRGGSNNDAD